MKILTLVLLCAPLAHMQIRIIPTVDTFERLRANIVGILPNEACADSSEKYYKDYQSVEVGFER